MPRFLKYPFAVFLVLATLLCALGAAPAQAAALVVNSNTDDTLANLAGNGTCDLREAIEAANTDAAVGQCPAGSGSDAIVFAADYTITLVAQLPAVISGSTLAINGNGAARSFISGASAYRVFQVMRGGDLTLDGLTVQNGNCTGACATHSGDSGSPYSGGGVYNAGTLTLTNSAFSGNRATYDGGGIMNMGGTLTVTNSTFTGNSSGDGGGGIANFTDYGVTPRVDSSLIITNSTFSGNSAVAGGGINNNDPATITDSTFTGNSAGQGGGIANSGYTMTISNSVFSGNTAIDNGSGRGGGIANLGTATVTGSVFSGNAADYGGGVLAYNAGGTQITNSVFSGNTAIDGGGAHVGGTNGVIVLRAAITITNSTFSGNTASNNGGGVFGATVAIMNITNSTFSGNAASSGGGVYGDSLNTQNVRNSLIANSPTGGDCSLTNTVVTTTNINNLVEDGSCSPALSGDPNLGPLQDNGGPTQTMALGAGSIALNAGDNATCAATDQRGVSRPQGAACDIGAYEVDTSSPTVSVEQASGQADPTSASPINFTATFNEPINTATFTTADVSLGGTAPGTLSAVVSEIAPNNGTTFNIAVSGMSGIGTVTASIGAGKVQDISGNLNTASSSSDNTVTWASSNADLGALSLSSGSLDPGFASGTFSYTASVANGVTSITATPTVADGNATVAVNGTAVVSGNASGAIALNVGSNTITVLVTAQDGTTTKTYTITVTRAAAPPPSNPSAPPLNPHIPGVCILPAIVDGSSPGFLAGLIATLSSTVGSPLVPVNQSTSGTIVLSGFNGGEMAFMPLSFSTGDPRPNGVYPLGNGQYQIVTDGTAATVAPAVWHLDQLTALLPVGACVTMEANGVLSATLGGVTYAVQPGLPVQLLDNPGGTAQLFLGNDGYLYFTDGSGNTQILYPGFLEAGTLLSALLTLDGSATGSIQLDGSALIRFHGQDYILVPDYTLGGVPPEHSGDSWWQEGPNRFRIRLLQRVNVSQGFTAYLR